MMWSFSIHFTKEHIFKIIDILMKGVMKRLTTLGFSLELTEEAKNFIAEKGYDHSLVHVHCTGPFRNTWKIRWRKKY